MSELENQPNNEEVPNQTAETQAPAQADQQPVSEKNETAANGSLSTQEIAFQLKKIREQLSYLERKIDSLLSQGQGGRGSHGGHGGMRGGKPRRGGKFRGSSRFKERRSEGDRPFTATQNQPQQQTEVKKKGNWPSFFGKGLFSR